MSLSVIIVNYKSAALILDCLKSAFQFPSAEQFEWIIVDNDSKDNSKALITENYPFVTWIEMGYNAGFARANNKGIRQAGGDTVLLLNPDTIILDNAIESCYLNMKNDPSCIAASAQLYNPDGSPQITGNYFITGGLNHLLPLPYLGNFLKMVALSGGIRKTNILHASKHESVDWINGAFLMVKQVAIGKAGHLDEDFFLYAEEIEWCSRLKKNGLLYVYNDLSTIHLQGESVGDTSSKESKGYMNLFDRRGLQLMMSMFVRIRKQFGIMWFLIHLVIYILEIPILIIGSILANLIHKKQPLEGWPQVKGYTFNVFKVLAYSKRIIANKPFFYKML